MSQYNQLEKSEHFYNCLIKFLDFDVLFSALLSFIIYKKIENKEKAEKIIKFIVFGFLVSFFIITVMFLFSGTSIFEIFLNYIEKNLYYIKKEKYIPTKFSPSINVMINMIFILPLMNKIIPDFLSNEIFPEKEKDKTNKNKN